MGISETDIVNPHKTYNKKMRHYIKQNLGVIIALILSCSTVSVYSQSKDYLYEKAYSLWSSKDEGNRAQANEIFMNLAQEGFAKAYPYAALSCIKNDVENFEFYGDLALDNGGSWIGKQLGDHYYETNQYVKAIRSYEGALKSGWKSDVALKLGKMYEEGIGVPVNYDKAKEYYKISIDGEHGGFIEHSEAYRRYKALGGNSLYDTEKFYAAEGNVDKSLSTEELFKKGENYLDGFGTSKDPYKGYAYIKASADKGYPKAMAKLSDIYISSLYGLNDADASKIYADLAISTYKKLAYQGDGDACCELGNCYKRGYLAEKDKEQSKKYYLQGAKLDHWHCIRYCGEFFEAEGDYAKALEYYKRAVAKKEMMAAFNLANMYYNGKGTPKDEAKAIELYKECAKSHWACKSDAISKLRSLGIDASEYD